ncbi:MAG TPA: hypothetical protein VL693_01780 [Vicinamibacterales bacterium]|jgi:hypothetical protein|nr:hypothetical protein [Vicinamibacterales bacterium]
MGVLEWIQNLPLSTSIAESDSLWWGYAWWLFVHALGMGLTAGIGFILCLRLLGVGRQIPLSSFRVLFRLFWIGFYLNLLSGTLLFMTDATGIARVWELYAKLACLGVVLALMVRLRQFVDSDQSDGVIPPRITNMAYACIVLWLAVITSGRLIAYAVEANGAKL